MNNKMTIINFQIETVQSAWNQLSQRVLNTESSDPSLDLLAKEAMIQVGELLIDVFNFVRMQAALSAKKVEGEDNVKIEGRNDLN